MTRGAVRAGYPSIPRPCRNQGALSFLGRRLYRVVPGRARSDQRIDGARKAIMVVPDVGTGRNPHMQPAFVQPPYIRGCAIYKVNPPITDPREHRVVRACDARALVGHPATPYRRSICATTSSGSSARAALSPAVSRYWGVVIRPRRPASINSASSTGSILTVADSVRANRPPRPDYHGSLYPSLALCRD